MKIKLKNKSIGVVLILMILSFASGFIGAKIGGGASYGVLYERIAPQAEALQSQNSRTFTLPELFAYSNPAVVAISTQTMGRNAFGQPVSRPSSGSGFFVSSNGYVVTNAHVIENATEITVVTYDGGEFNAEVVGMHIDTDLAVLKIDAGQVVFLPFGNSDLLQVGEQVAAMGNPLGEFSNSMSVGYISGLERNLSIDASTRNLIQTDAAVNAGNSGGPLLDLNGAVIGVVNAKHSGFGVEGLGFAIPSNVANIIVSQLIESGEAIGRMILGVYVSQEENGLVVLEIIEGGLAEAFDIREGDFLRFANGRRINSVADLRAVLDRVFVDETLTLVIERDGESVTKYITQPSSRT